MTTRERFHEMTFDECLIRFGIIKGLIDELWNIGDNMPVFAGYLCSHQSAQALINFGLAMRYEGDYVLTEKGKNLLQKIKDEVSAVWSFECLMHGC